MRCAWKQLLAILPPKYRSQVEAAGREQLEQIRLGVGSCPQLQLGGKPHWLPEPAVQADVDYVINAASRYSPWTAATMAQGYLTAPGGHRIGLCGEAVCRGGSMEGLRRVQSVCIRVAKDYPGIARSADFAAGSVLILGAPGWGKTTLLRDLIRRRSESSAVAVVDERRELFPEGFSQGKHLDVLSGCPKHQALERLLRTMSPECIAVDEITEQTDAQALLKANHCGVCLLATAHAASLEDFQKRQVYRPLVEQRVFSWVILLHRDKSYTLERMVPCAANG